MFLIRFLIRSYQLLVAPIIRAICGPNGGCRFTPTCSHYFLEACEVHGVWRGGWLGIKRLARCQPWGNYGPDPVPRTLGARKSEIRNPKSETIFK
jgi:putative membrane protein insertion efficiency factor